MEILSNICVFRLIHGHSFSLDVIIPAKTRPNAGTYGKWFLHRRRGNKFNFRLAAETDYLRNLKLSKDESSLCQKETRLLKRPTKRKLP